MCKYYVGYVQFRTFGSLDYADLYTNKVAMDVPYVISHISGYFDFAVFAYLAMQLNKMGQLLYYVHILFRGFRYF